MVSVVNFGKFSVIASDAIFFLYQLNLYHIFYDCLTVIGYSGFFPLHSFFSLSLRRVICFRSGSDFVFFLVAQGETYDFKAACMPDWNLFTFSTWTSTTSWRYFLFSMNGFDASAEEVS